VSRRTPDLSVRWSKREKALLYFGSKPTGGLLALVFEGHKPYGKTIAEELIDRGYDLTTLRFSIRRRMP